MYRERGPKTWSVVCVSLYVAAVAATGVAALPENPGAWLAVSGLYVFALVPLLIVPISKYVYHRIDLAPDTLRVGRERIPVADIDPRSVRTQLRRATENGGASVLRNVATSMNSGFTFRGRNVADKRLPRLVGGAWAVPMGMGSVAIANRRGQQLLIATRHPEEFLRALAEATEATEATDGPEARR
ncbi:hypothetical protein [Streptomyces sp. 6N223]|uniref:hypothetical protein n=1 Tax=Streptomyces sp. 6N223 TaxID=3457412 RepID=UPI003FCF79F9